MKMLKQAIKYVKFMGYTIRKLPNKDLYKCIDLHSGETDIVDSSIIINYYKWNNVGE